MRTKLRPLILVAALALSAQLFAATRQTDTDAADIVNCRVLEAHTGTNPPVIAVVFHQRDRADQARLGSLLQNLSSEAVEMRIGDGKWTSVTVAWLKSCFGRGLLLLASDAPELKDGATFVLRFSRISAQN
jgi:hypothetical protein